MTFAAKENDPVASVLPEIIPPELNWIPDGNVPVLTLHLYGDTPPLAERELLYCVPLTASPIEFVLIAREGIGATVRFTEAFALAFSALVAVTVTVVLLLTAGAVNLPVLEMIPAVADQVTAVLDVPVIAALNCSTLCARTVAPDGEIVIWGCELRICFETLMLETPVPWSFEVASETDNVKLKFPATVGTPEMEPV